MPRCVQKRTVKIRHWLPILTYCPVNKLPDLVYITVEFGEEFHELYAVRKRVRELVSGKLMFMEDIAQMLADEYPDAKEITVRLALDRHVVTVRNIDV